MKTTTVLFAFATFLVSASAFLPSTTILPKPRLSSTKVKALPFTEMTNTFLSQAAEEMAGPPLDTYGTVDAPGWVLPLGALLVISTAALIPLALKPGAEAFEEERKRLAEDEDPLVK